MITKKKYISKLKWALEEISGLHDKNITDFLTKEPIIKTDEEFKWDINDNKERI